MTYQPEYAATRETWCPLTRDNWISNSANALTIAAPDALLPLHIHMELELLYENRFSLVLNPDWFINYAGSITISVPEATKDQFHDTVWKIVLPPAGRLLANRRLFLLYNCSDVKFRYDIREQNILEAAVTFIDMRSNMSFSVKTNVEKAQLHCNKEIFVVVNNSSSTTSQTILDTTISEENVINSTKWNPSNAGFSLEYSAFFVVFINTLLFSLIINFFLKQCAH